MIEQIDFIFPLIILVGGLYGFLKGPFSLILPFVASFFMFPFLMYVKPYLFTFLQSSENLKVYHLVYYPISGFFIFALVGMLARKLDHTVKKYIPGGKGLWGFIIGVFITSFICIAFMLFTLPLMMEFAPKYISKSWTLTSMAVWFQENPKRYNQLQSFLHIDTIKGALIKVKTLRDGGQVLQDDPISEDEQQAPTDKMSVLKSKAEIQNQKHVKELEQSLYGQSNEDRLRDSVFENNNVNDLIKSVYKNTSIKELQDTIYKEESSEGSSNGAMSTEKLNQLKQQLQKLIELQNNQDKTN